MSVNANRRCFAELYVQSRDDPKGLVTQPLADGLGRRRDRGRECALDLQAPARVLRSGRSHLVGCHLALLVILAKDVLPVRGKDESLVFFPPRASPALVALESFIA